MPAAIEWTPGMLRTLRGMWNAKASVRDIADALDLSPATVGYKAKELKLGARYRIFTRVQAAPGDGAVVMQQRLAARDAEAAREGRDLTGVLLGDPQPWRSALMQAPSAGVAERPKISLGHIERGPLGRGHGIGGRTMNLRRLRRETEARP